MLASYPLLLTLSLSLLILTFSTTTTITAAAAQILDDVPILSSEPLDLDHRVKRLFPHTYNQCSLCFSTYDPASCWRCWRVQSTVVPVYATKRDLGFLPETGKRGYEPLLRFQRGSGCGCCYHSRFSNSQCCAICSMSTKRVGKRSEGRLRSSDDLPMMSDWAVVQRDAEAQLSVDCLCCARDGEWDCCDRCFAK